MVLFFATAFNFPFVREAYRIGIESGNTWVAYGSPFLLLLFLTVVFSVLMIPYLHRIIFPVMMVMSAAIAYFEIFYGITFDNNMLINVLQTNVAEGIRMLNLSYVLFVLFLGVLPAIGYCFIRIKPTTFKKELITRGGILLVSLLLVAVMAVFSFKSFSTFFRNNSYVKSLVLPSNFIGAGINQVRYYIRDSIPYTELDINAHQSKNDNYKHLTILVVGETTRAQNWGLNGYSRQTTPKLASRGDRIINFRNVSSCGTATAVSVPCMFSIQTRENYNAYVSEKTDNILDIMKRAGVDVYWLDNDLGCKGGS